MVNGDADGPFNCAASRNIAVAAADTELLIVADADTLVDDLVQIDVALDWVAGGQADLVYPFTEYRHIDKAWALKDFRQAPTQRTYPESPGGIFVLTKRTLERFGGFDEHFTAGLDSNGSCFGFDDTAFWITAKTLGTVARVPGIAWSFNHVTDARGNPARDFGRNNPNRARWLQYRAARGNPAAIRELVFNS